MPVLKEKKILLISNDTSCAQIILMLLKSWGYEAVWVKQGNESISAVSRTMPDLVIIDYGPIGSDGLGVIKSLKANYHTAHIPILMMINKRNIRRDILQIEQGLDDYLLKPPDPIDLEVRIEMALRRTEHQFFANPLSKLPGSRMLEKIVNQKLAANESFSFLYCDINNFKSFNDKYGYKCGDAVIIQAAHILTSVVRSCATDKDFVFHIGGDDFVVIASCQRESDISKRIIGEFDRLMPYHYSALDRQRGFIRIKDRRGKNCDFDLIGISISIVNNLHRKINSLIEFIEIAFEIKSYLKSHKQSRSLVNRRKTHVPKEFEAVAQEKKQISAISAAKDKHNSPLGQMLLEKKLINHEQLEEALIKHWSSNVRLGQVLLDMNIVDTKHLSDILKELKVDKESDLVEIGKKS